MAAGTPRVEVGLAPETLASFMAAEVLLPPRGRLTAVSTDTRAMGPGTVFFALVGERFDGHEFLLQAAEGGAAAVVVARDRALPLEELARRGVGVYAVSEPLAALQALAAHHRAEEHRAARVIGVTGSVGKTTTKEF